MPFLDEVGLQTFWENCKDKFGNKLKVTQNATTVDVALQTVDEEDLATGTIPQASTTAAGVMTAADKEKLNGIESGATANSGTITEVKGSDPIIGSGTQGSVTLSHADSGVADGAYGDDSATPVTPSFGATFNVPGFAVNDKGHVTSASTHTVKIPDSVASQAADGLMSQEDKTKLDGIEDGATANVGTITGVSASSPLSGGGNSGNVTISHINSGVTAGTKGDTTEQTPTWGETFKAVSATVNATGHVTDIDEHTVMIPNNEATESASGLMSSEDKNKLNNIAENANYYVLPEATSTSLGGIKLGYQANSKFYPIKVDENGDAYVNVPWENTTYTLGSFGLTATAQELNYMDGVTSNVQTQLNGKAASSHKHAAADVTSGTFALDRIPTITDAKISGLSASKLIGTIPSANLPSYVDDVIEGSTTSDFPGTGEAGKIYVATSTNKTYRWSGSGYIEISASLALGTTSSTAFRGDYGNTAYQHATAKGAAFNSGLYKITTNAQGHVTAATAVTKTDITDLGIPGQDTKYSLSSFGITATAAELNKLDGVTATATEINYLDGVTSAIQTQLNGKAASSHTHSNATTSAAGFLPKLGGGTTNFLRADGTWAKPPDTNTTYSVMKGATSSASGSIGLVPAPAAGKQTSFLRGDGTWVVPTNTTYSNMTGATTSAAGKAGLVPAPSAGAATRYLRSDGTWAVPPDTNTTYTLSSFGITATASELNKLDGCTATVTELNYVDGVTSNIQTQLNGKAASSHSHAAATTSANGFMTTAMVTKLNGIATGANKYTLPTASSSTLGGVKVGSNLTISSGVLTAKVASDADFKAYMGIS